MTDSHCRPSTLDGDTRQSPSGAGVMAPDLDSPPSTTDAAINQAASAFLAALRLKQRDPWPLARTTLVVQMWFRGVATRLIAVAAGVTKNALIGRAHRMGLPPRPSPIGKRRGEMRAAPVQRAIPARKATLPPLLSVDLTAQHNVVVPTPTLPPPPPQPPPPTPELRAVSPAQRPTLSCVAPLRLVPPAPPPVVFRPRALAPCLWPFGDPGTKSFRFCGDPGVVGKPYCPVHMRKAYVPAPRRVH